MKIVSVLVSIGCIVAALILVLTALGESETETETTGANPPTAYFTYTITNPDTGGPVVFTNGSTDPDGDIVEYLWDFGDGTTSTEENPTHQYSSGGTYTVTLTVTDSKNHTNSYGTNITVKSEGYPNAFFVYSPVTPTTNDIIQFTDQSTDPDGTIVSWHWDFGDGNTSTERNPTHQYSTSGYGTVIFTIRLTVTDNDGHTDTYQTGIAVSPG